MCWPGEKAGKADSSSASTVTFYGMLGVIQILKNLELEHDSLNLAKHMKFMQSLLRTFHSSPPLNTSYWSPRHLLFKFLKKDLKQLTKQRH